MTDKGTLILNDEDIQQKTRRIAYEILENNYDENELILVGIKDLGYVFAEKLFTFLKKIGGPAVSLYSISINKKKPVSEDTAFDFDPAILKNKVVVLIDDVGNTGRTLCYSIKPLLESLPKKVEVAVLVDRQHKSFPIRADYVGLSLSTTMKEHVTVVFNQAQGDAAYLS